MREGAQIVTDTALSSEHFVRPPWTTDADGLVVAKCRATKQDVVVFRNSLSEWVRQLDAVLKEWGTDGAT